MKILLIPLVLLLSHIAFASTAINIHPDENYQLVKDVDFLMDETNALDINNIQDNANWSKVKRRNINFGFIKGTLWLRFKVVAQVDSAWVLYIYYPLLDHLESTGIINGKVGETIVTGDQVKFTNRPVNNPGFAFPYKLKKSDVLEVYLKVNTLGAAEVPLNLVSEEEFSGMETVRNFLWGWMNGIFIVMLLYNLFIYFVVRERVYLFYVICVLTNVIFLGVFNGTWFQYGWPNTPEFNHPLFSFLNGFMYFITLLFVVEFLQIFERKAWYRIYFKYLLVGLAMLPILSLFMTYQTIVLIEVLGALMMNLSGLAIGVYLSIKGEALARLFTLAWSMFMIGLICTNLKSFGLLPSNWFTIYAFQFGSFIEVTVLSMALAYRIDAANTEKSKAQKENIQNLQRYQNLYSGSLSGQFQMDFEGTLLNVNPAFYKMLGYSSENELLSLSKDERNKKLDIKQDAYQVFFENLNNKTELVSFESRLADKNKEKKWYSITMVGVRGEQGELKYYEGSMIGINELKENERIEINAVKDKMVAMEHLVIGICHEMNTPLGVATTGLSHLVQGSEELSKIFKSGELTKAKFTELLNEGGEAISIIDENLDRLNVLIKRFRDISILQRNYNIMEFDLKSLLETQVLLESRVLDEHNIRVNCPADITIKGYPQALSDMFKQFINNSIRHGFLNEFSGEIEISVNVEKKDVVIVYNDNGIGIPLAKHKEIFNPFYTTQRGSSENIGLGMFQVFNIVTQLFKGDINVNDVNEGFELVIRFPIKSA